MRCFFVAERPGYVARCSRIGAFWGHFYAEPVAAGRQIAHRRKGFILPFQRMVLTRRKEDNEIRDRSAGRAAISHQPSGVWVSTCLIAGTIEHNEYFVHSSARANSSKDEGAKLPV
jgi:hypothetical protein